MTHTSVVRVVQPAKRLKGWRLFYRSSPTGPRRSMLFPDRKHGGKRKARAAAERMAGL